MSEKATAIEKLVQSSNDESIGEFLKRAPQKTRTEVQFTNHLADLLKVGVSFETENKRVGLTYGHSVLAAVVYEKYDEAIEELENVLNLRVDYPSFRVRAGRYIQHAKSLVRAIKAKRSIGKLPHVSRAKQKELMNTLTIHFNDLRNCVINIEKIEKKVRREDLSSTRWFVVTTYWTIFALFIFSVVWFVLPTYFIAIHAVFTDMLQTVLMAIVNFVWPV